MNKNFVIAFISKDKDIILEPLAEFDGNVMYFVNASAARQYLQKLYINSSVQDIEPFSIEDGLSIVRVQ
jgi:hypothetical protein